MISDGFCEQSLRVCQRKDLFGKSIKRAFAQILCLRCDALDRSTAGDKPVRPLAPFSLCIVGSAVFNLRNLLYLILLAQPVSAAKSENLSRKSDRLPKT